MSKRQRSHLERLFWSTVSCCVNVYHVCVKLTLGTSNVLAAPYLHNDMRQNNAQQSMDSMSPVEKFLNNQAVVHTFDTIESCTRKCPRQCIMQEVSDLMDMPRYICPAKGTISSELTPLMNVRGDRAVNEDLLPFSSQYFLILVPLMILFFAVILIVWCRKCSSNGSSSLDWVTGLFWLINLLTDKSLTRALWFTMAWCCN